jgi:single-strand DNA-binding protein
MASLNRCVFIGNLGRDPESSVAKTGVKVTRFSLAVNEKYKEQETTTWINIVTFDKLAEITAQYLRKGQLVYVEGRIQTPKIFDRQDGSKGTSLDLIANQVVFLERKRDDAVDQHNYSESSESPGRVASPAQSALPNDDDLPF